MDDIMSLWASEPERFSSRSSGDAALFSRGIVKSTQDRSQRSGSSTYSDDALKRLTTARLNALRDSLSRILNSQTSVNALCDGGDKLRAHVDKIQSVLDRRAQSVDGADIADFADTTMSQSALSLDDITAQIASMSFRSRTPLSAPSRVAYLPARESAALVAADTETRRRFEREINFKLAQRNTQRNEDRRGAVDYESGRDDGDDDDDGGERDDDDAADSDSESAQSDTDDMRVGDVVERLPPNAAANTSPFVQPITASRTANRIVRIGAANTDTESERRVRFADG